MLLPYRILSNDHKRSQMTSNRNLDDDSHRERDIKKPQMTSKDLKRLNSINLSQVSTVPLTTQRIKRNKLKGGSVHLTDETNNEYLGKILHNKNL